jgi:thiol-disulfide isomerase/thioredoxin
VKLPTLAVAGVLLLALAGCTADPLAQQYEDGSGSGYVSGDGANLELPVDERGEPVEFSGEDTEGNPISSEDLRGEVYVVNFWYASCPPCRVEAPILKTLSDEYTDVAFLGVNTKDAAAFASTFETTFGIDYPSILDADSAQVQLAFAGSVAPNAVPTTLVVDREGRVAARISGLIRDESILAAMIDRVVAEQAG